MEYDYPQPLPAEVIQNVVKRNEIARSYISKSNVGYYGIRSGIRLETLWERIQGKNLLTELSVNGDSLLEELERRAQRYFYFKIDLFRFYHRRDRGLQDILRAPLSHAELEEENIEQKFPDDISARALMRALNLVIEKNQKLHIFHKRCIQLAFTLPILIITIFLSKRIFLFGKSTVFVVNHIIPEYISVITLSFVSLVIIYLLYYLSMKHIIVFCLNVVTDLFKSANSSSCDRVTTDLTNLNGKIAQEFNKLVATDIAASQANYRDVVEDNWPERAEKVFKIALWTARRIEHLERFWQIQFERLRIFELVSDKAGNYISLSLWLFSLAMTAVGTYLLLAGDSMYLQIHGFTAFVLFCAVSWKVAALTRKQEFSFGIEDILRQEFNKWVPFGTLRYYDIIATQFRNDKAEYQKQLKSRTKI